jgi:hypothetical protein
MKYNQPFGISDPEAAYVNGNPSTGVMGSIPPAASVEYDQREIIAVIKYAFDKGLIDFNNVPCAAPTNADLTQLLKAIFGMARQNKLQASMVIYINSFTGDDVLADGTVNKPYRTHMAAIAMAQSTLDLNLKHTITFHSTGNFTNSGLPFGHPIVYLAGLFAGQNGAASIIFNNNAATFTGNNCACFYINQGAQIVMYGGTYSATTDGVTSNTGIAIEVGGQAIVMGNGWTFGACGNAHFWIGGDLWLSGGGYTVTAGAPNHLVLSPGANFSTSNGPINIALQNNPAFGRWVSNYGGAYGISATITGTATGQKYIISGYGVISTNGAGVNFLPGNTAGYIYPNTGNGEYT